MTAAEHNRVLRAASRRADALEGRMVATLEPILRRVGDESARRFERYVTDHLTADARRRADADALRTLPLDDRRRQAPLLELRAAAGNDAVPAAATMICVKPRPEEARAIADPDGDPPESLHVTLAYLGQTDGPLAAVAEPLRGVAATHGPLVGQVGGYGVFDPAGVGILLPDVPGLVELRVAVTEALVAAGVEYGRDHGFAAHITVHSDPEVGEQMAALERAAGAPLHFDALLVVRGDREVVEVPLVGVPPLTAGGKKPPPGGRPDWTAPDPAEVLDVAALVAQLRARTDPVRVAMIETTMTPALKAAGLSFDVTNPLIGKALAKTGKHITSIAETTRADAMRVIRESYDAGLSIPDTALAIRAAMTDASKVRATMIARCLPPETPVDAAVVRAVTRRWYEGDMVVLGTESGREFTATPNHPMLTSAGWRAAGEVNEGDHLIRSFGQEHAGAPSHEDVAHPPATIVEVFEAAAAVGIIERRAGGEPDFHGDGLDGEVEIAWPYRELTLGKFAALYESSVQKILAPSGVAGGTGFCARCRRLLAVDQSRCVCGATAADTALAEYARYERIGYAERLRQRLYALAGYEPRDYLVHGGVLTSGWRPAASREELGACVAERATLDPGSLEPVQDGALVNADGGADLYRARPCDVELDRVVAYRLIPYAGHVFNLCTPYGYFIVNGGYTGNTELAGGVNGGSLAATQLVADATGENYSKTWITAPGAKFPRHEDYPDLDGQTVGLDEPFDVGDSQMQHPGDPDGEPGEVIGCRCAMTYGGAGGEETEVEVPEEA